MLRQLLNAFLPIFKTVFGMNNEGKELQLLNAASPISVVELGIISGVNN